MYKFICFVLISALSASAYDFNQFAELEDLDFSNELTVLKYEYSAQPKEEIDNSVVPEDSYESANIFDTIGLICNNLGKELEDMAYKLDNEMFETI